MKKTKAVPGDSRRRTPKSPKADLPISSNGRRSHRRYPVDLFMRCKLSGTGRILTGRVCDISSSGIQFVSSEIIPRTTKVELQIDWPVLLNGVCRLQLRVYGRVIRSDVKGTAASISRYQFYTAGTLSPVSVPEFPRSNWLGVESDIR